MNNDLVKFAIMATAVTALLGIVLWKNAQNFDSTEVKAMIEFVVALVVGRGGIAFVVSKMAGSGEQK